MSKSVRAAAGIATLPSPAASRLPMISLRIVHLRERLNGPAQTADDKKDGRTRRRARPICNKVFPSVAVRIVGIGVVAIRHAVPVLVAVVLVRHAVAIAVAVGVVAAIVGVA